MRLLIVSSQSHEKVNTFVKVLYKYLQPYKILHSGFKPFICDDKSIFLFPLNINIIRVLIKRLAPILYTYFYNKSLQKFLIKNEIDLVLCNFGTQGANVTPACVKTGLPQIVYFYGYDAYIYSVLKKYKKRYAFMFAHASKLLVVSQDLLFQLVKLGAPKDKIIINPCGFDINDFGRAYPEKSDKRLLFVGRFVEKKAPDLLLRAFDKTVKEVPDAQLIMIGGGELNTEVVSLIASLKLEKSVQLMGFQPPEIVTKEIQKARAYVQHSRTAKDGDSEGTPVSIVEASGSGLPVVSTRHGGIKETVIDGITGFLVDEGDWESMANYMVKLLNDPVLAGKMGVAGRDHILKNYTVDQQIKMLKEIMNEVVKK